MGLELEMPVLALGHDKILPHAMRDFPMAQQSPDPRSPWDVRGWSITKILLALVVAAAFITMLTWDRGHFSGERPTPTQQTK
jgi:hypothetical protein